ncbi:MAG: SpoIID/LytB domain-containing protein, partial [Acutalibacteraceae bacterium]
MKMYHLTMTAVLAVTMVIFPSLGLLAHPAKSEREPEEKKLITESVGGAFFDVLDTSSGEVTRYSERDYLFGVVAAEMPASYPSESLKAQAVASYTVACKRRAAERANPDESMLGADITSDYTIDQAFITREKARENWGEAAERYENKLDAAIDSVLGEVLTYEGEIAETLFFAISNGKTEYSENVFS